MHEHTVDMGPDLYITPPPPCEGNQRQPALRRPFVFPPDCSHNHGACVSAFMAVSPLCTYPGYLADNVM